MAALDQGGALIFNPKMRGLQIQARNLRGHFDSFARAAGDIHRAVVMDMAHDAAERLDATAVRPTDMRTGRLRQAILNPDSHVATIDGFVFLDADAMYRQAVYWRLIEEGTRRFIGQRRRFLFLSGRTGRPVKPNKRRRGQDMVMLGSEEEGTPFITISTPIRPHLYADHAIRRFSRDNYATYRQTAQRVAADHGLRLVIN